jgi:putative DNA primase/helicase
LATNELPFLKSADQSIKRRFVFIHLKQSFLGKEDPTLKDKLKEEKNEIFVWAIE